MNVDRQALLARICTDPAVCGGLPCIRGTRMDVGIVLDSLAEGLTVDEIVDHFPQLTGDDVRAAIAYAGELAREHVWKVAG